MRIVRLKSGNSLRNRIRNENKKWVQMQEIVASIESNLKEPIEKIWAYGLKEFSIG